MVFPSLNRGDAFNRIAFPRQFTVFFRGHLQQVARPVGHLLRYMYHVIFSLGVGFATVFIRTGTAMKSRKLHPAHPGLRVIRGLFRGMPLWALCYFRPRFVKLETGKDRICFFPERLVATSSILFFSASFRLSTLP